MFVPFNLVCDIDGCKYRFVSFSAFNSHVYRDHRKAMGLQVSGGTALQPPAVEVNDEEDIGPGNFLKRTLLKSRFMELVVQQSNWTTKMPRTMRGTVTSVQSFC